MSRYNHKNKWSQEHYMIRTAGALLTIIILVVLMPRESIRTYHYSQGKPWDYATLIAEDSFPVLKSEEQQLRERDSILQYAEPYYNLQSQVVDTMIQSWHLVYTKELKGSVPSYFEGYVAARLKEIYSKGILSTEEAARLHLENTHNLHIINGNKAILYSADEIYSPKTAYESLIMSQDSISYPHNYLQLCKLNRFVSSNLTFDAEKSDQQRQEIESLLTPYIGQVVTGQKIVDRGQIVDHHIFRMLKSMELYEKDKEKSTTEILMTLGGQTVYISLIIIMLLTYFQQFRNDYLGQWHTMLLSTVLFLMFPLLSFAISGTTAINAYVLPFCIIPIFIRIFLDSRTAFITHLMSVLVAAIVVNQPVEFIIVQTLAGLTAIVSLRELTQRSDLFRTVLLVLAVSLVTYVSIELLTGRLTDFNDINQTDVLCLTAGCLMLMVSYLLLIPIEKVFGFTSNVTLIELSNANTPLLRQMSEEAPGTFQHSIQVSNLAAAVAEKIGAKSQLVRTGALYHDIGKIRHAVFFTENQNGINPHNRLTNEQSAQIIINHVKEGVALAEKNKLPKVICDFIATHHGTSMARYFYVQAQNKSPEQVLDKTIFTYPGPNPQTKEQAILMMCDAVEAASRSLKEITEENISNLVDRLVDNQVQSGFFNESPITFLDIAMAKDVLKSKLRTIYHTRIQYPELKTAKKDSVETEN